mgnify:CR=1 FL=1
MNRFANYYKKIFSQEYIDRTISGGIKSQLTLLLVTIATALAIFFDIAMLFFHPIAWTRGMGRKALGSVQQLCRSR